ncbi:MAG: hypothetical protein KF830_14375 [Planctomycetes bacterium]|nr:hypothetical protein [Planctomycetota bacterium]
MQIPYTTHDWTVWPGGEGGPFVEAWADVKTPGDGRQYTVGTIEVRNTDTGASFSGAPAQPVSGAPAFTLGPPARRQVVMLQCTDAAQAILWQRYFYGITPDDETRASNARAVAVWPTDDPLTTRIVICGETYDRALPLEAASFPAATTLAPTGFIAVLNGDGVLLWTHHVFGVDQEQSCAITDVSIRVEAMTGNEVVTYCGISSHGNPGAGVPLAPKKWFEMPSGPPTSAGDTDHGTGQWDGIVGRVSFGATQGKFVEFHAIVGGPEQDGLFGLAEIAYDPEAKNVDRFVAVGASQSTSPTGAPAGMAHPGFGTVNQPYYMGTMAFFDAIQVRSTGNLVLEFVQTFGQPSSEAESYFTIARDVLVLKDGYPGTQTLIDMVAVAGSTNDPLLAVTAVVDPSPAHAVLQGDTDGFLATVIDAIPGSPLLFQAALHGGPDRDGLTGVQGWNEFPDQMSVVGFRQSQADQDVLVASYHLGMDSPPASSFGQLHSVREDVFGGSSVDRPTAMGTVHATTVGLAFVTGPIGDPLLLGEPAGGGIAVDARARVNVVGQTLSTDYLASYTVTTPGRATNALPDAMRTIVDMLPFAVSAGIGRTDGTGDPNGFSIASGFSGGTTPQCALSPFGWRIGEYRPELKRMLVDYVGPDPGVGVTGASLVVSRPTAPILPSGAPSSIMGAFFEITIPSSTPYFHLPDGVELWVSPANVLSPLFVDPNQAYRVDLLFPSGTGGPLAVQFFCLIDPSSPVAGGNPGSCTPSTATLTASPAIWIPY